MAEAQSIELLAEKMPLFSVIIPTYNRGELIYPTLDSVLSQSERDFELIVVDDGSTDGTWDVLQRYSNDRGDARLSLIHRKNGGTTAARNTGIEAAKGRYVALLDHDDLWFTWTLESHRRAIERFGEPSFCAGSVVARDLKTLKLETIPREELAMQEFADFLASPVESWPIYPSGWTIRTDVLRSVGGFFPFHLGLEDHDLMLRLGEAHGYIRLDKPYMAVRGLHDSNLTSDKQLNWFMDGLETLIEREGNGQYPGGAARATSAGVYLRGARPLSMACLRLGKFRKARRIYRLTFAWHLRMGRWRFLLGQPTITLARYFRAPAPQE